MPKKPYRLVEQDMEQMEQKIRAHRIKVLKWTALLALLALLVAACIYYVYSTRKYDQYQVVSSVEREDSPGTEFMTFQGNILKYNNDGIFCLNGKNELIWNQTYEMQSPMVDICGDYVAVADYNGKNIYIMDTQGPCGQIEAPRAITRVYVAGQGTVAVLMEENRTGYIQLYHRDGTFLAEGELHAQNKGYPLDIAISPNGQKMMVAMQDLNQGTVRTTVTFFNFGSVGQNEIDNVVALYSYEDLVIPRVEFMGNDIAVAVGDTHILFYEGSQKPVLAQDITLEREIRSVFSNDDYLGLVYENENSDNTYGIEIYDSKGSFVREFGFSMEYDAIEFLQNNEICIRNNLEASIYTVGGLERFHYNFAVDLYQIIHVTGRQYLFLTRGYTQQVRLK